MDWETLNVTFTDRNLHYKPSKPDKNVNKADTLIAMFRMNNTSQLLISTNSLLCSMHTKQTRRPKIPIPINRTHLLFKKGPSYKNSVTLYESSTTPFLALRNINN